MRNARFCVRAREPTFHTHATERARHFSAQFPLRNSVSSLHSRSAAITFVLFEFRSLFVPTMSCGRAWQTMTISSHRRLDRSRRCCSINGTITMPSICNGIIGGMSIIQRERGERGATRQSDMTFDTRAKPPPWSIHETRRPFRSFSV